MIMRTMACCLLGSLCLVQAQLPHAFSDEQPITDSDRQHWSFTPLVQPAVPGLASSAARGPIDAFIAEGLASEQLELAPEADAMQLLRRLTFDLTGLPPTAEALERFRLSADLPDAYEREVNRLLASPGAGQHLAQSWLDLARFAETDGFEHDLLRPEAWRYRDWVIQAINNDMPYDQFMRWQVAGDLVSQEESAKIATMFCLSGPDMPDLNDQVERRHNLLNEMTGTVSAVMLGLQMGCAACHDHKTDPISQADFYRLRGVLACGVPALQRDKPWASLVEQSNREDIQLFHRGDHRHATDRLTAGLPRIAADDSLNRAVATSKHPRVELADWLTSESNPLPARVEANRQWQAHFGAGLSSTSGDLGLMGDQPSSTELLDYLATQLRQHDWSRQWLSRQIVLSATYRQTSHPSSHTSEAWQARLERDPNNRLLSRYPRRRLTGEVLRDAMLQVAGLMNRQMSGPGVMPPLPEELRSALLPGQWKASDNPADHARRSIYIFARRNLRYPIFDSFDRPDAGASCPQRNASVTATQSLLMFNSEFSYQIAQAMAERLSSTEDSGLADQLWQRVLMRDPEPAERQLLGRLLGQFDDRRAGISAAALALLNSNEFITLD